MLLTICAFSSALKNDFLNYDDPIFVVNNLQVNHGFTFANIKWAFTTFEGGIWMPLAWFSHMLDSQIYGLKPWGHHLTSVLIHALNTVLVFAWLQRLTGARWKSFMVAALFGLHPLRVESVAWIAERKDVLSAFFWLVTLLAYTEYAKNCSRKLYVLALASFVLGLMSKPMLVTLPFVLLLLDWWPLNRWQPGGNVRWLIFEKLPFFFLSAAASIIAFAAQKNHEMVIALSRLSLVDRFENSFVSYLNYIGKFFWPENLAVFYPQPDKWQIGLIVVSIVLLVVISIVSVWFRQRQPYLLVGWLWFLGTAVPVIGIVQLGNQAMADRYTYIPEIGLTIIVVWIADAATKNWRRQFFTLSSISTLLIVACTTLTVRQIGFWRNSETLFKHTIEVTGKNVIAEANLADALMRDGKTDEAISHYQKALQIDSTYADFHINYGNALSRKGDINAAVMQYQQALRLKPDSADAYYDLAVAFGQIGLIKEAVVNYQKALEFNPHLSRAYFNLGAIYYQNGRLNDAITNYQKALEIDPYFVQAYGNLGTALFTSGHVEDAIANYQKALQLNPEKANIRFALSAALFQIGKSNEAVASAQQALRLAADQTNAALVEIIQRQLQLYQTKAAPR